MDDQFTAETSSIKENNAPVGWFLTVLSIGFAVLCVAYFFLYRSTDSVSVQGPETTAQTGPAGP